MPRFQLKGTLTRDAITDLWKHTLSRIPTVTGQLAYLASLRDPNSGTYKHHGFAATFGKDESTRALRESHEMVFRQWLALGLADRAADLRQYIGVLEESGGEVAGFWLSSGHTRLLVPSSALPMERELFQQDVETLLKTIQNADPGGDPR
jgi:hypothetical protein